MEIYLIRSFSNIFSKAKSFLHPCVSLKLGQYYYFDRGLAKVFVLSKENKFFYGSIR